ncbi:MULTISPECIES: tyrosine-type recombinase/integrase [Collimonas]|uniref:tyrosine-type recombinase/integrase n=1 Tax=Collimonas TaxID=202907 RepID=UPI0013E38BC6|nr:MULTISPECIES: tyrosine-type recombinase/integrase [Collimonas]
MSSHLSHLARYCYANSIQFWDLDDNSFKDFVCEFLVNQTRSSRGFTQRKNTTNGNIVATCISFLTWLQANLITDRVLVGPRNTNPQIRLIEKRRKSRYGTSSVLVYPFSPIDDTPEPKGPMSDAIRNKLWAANSSSDNSNTGIYLQARREQLLALLEATGSRPAELAHMLLEDNKTSVKEGALFLPTKKRRKLKDPTKRVPATLEITIGFKRYIEVERAQLVQHLRAQGKQPDTRHVFITSDHGKPLTEWAITKDFQRLVIRAGVDERACMSMLRHRFVTILVALHLQDYVENNGITSKKQLIMVDQITILTRVATITGHADPLSLLPYIDLGWDYLGVFKPIEKASQIARFINESAVHVRTLGKIARTKTSITKAELVASVATQLDELEARIRRLLENPEPSADKL